MGMTEILNLMQFRRDINLWRVWNANKNIETWINNICVEIGPIAFP